MDGNGNGNNGDAGNDGGSESTQEALQESCDNDSEAFAEQWGIDTESGTLTPTDAPEGTETQ